ncbi:transmembrane protein, putative (macronuclear) [Tetrahymena thermophila SB210]|uniref:Transmembrane protein, putative n=1 Tax=Tetrahymena thermophila (strain SB210) TaxID=312017 RepID=W7XBD5_TETTS|nr:transmembrane protein, putative [Tetrahymena thermophila SB210]EWS70991.1 transmembrane protein, putative [Tetrahymena thermophila SB210]|eukprot:XP_012656475.1 transmembrane protein, putative [Tetrahymena thermophila SB210]
MKITQIHIYTIIHRQINQLIKNFSQTTQFTASNQNKSHKQKTSIHLLIRIKTQLQMCNPKIQFSAFQRINQNKKGKIDHSYNLIHKKNIGNTNQLCSLRNQYSNQNCQQQYQFTRVKYQLIIKVKIKNGCKLTYFLTKQINEQLQKQQTIIKHTYIHKHKKYTNKITIKQPNKIYQQNKQTNKQTNKCSYLIFLLQSIISIIFPSSYQFLFVIKCIHIYANINQLVFQLSRIFFLSQSKQIGSQITNKQTYKETNQLNKQIRIANFILLFIYLLNIQKIYQLKQDQTFTVYKVLIDNFLLNNNDKYIYLSCYLFYILNPLNYISFFNLLIHQIKDLTNIFKLFFKLECILVVTNILKYSLHDQGIITINIYLSIYYQQQELQLVYQSYELNLAYFQNINLFFNQNVLILQEVHQSSDIQLNY